MVLRGIREAGKAHSWYQGDPDVLSKQLDGFLDDVPPSIKDVKLPVPGARVIIAPHAGYSYSGPCAAWAYKCLDLSNAKRIFVFGPSHTYYLRGCALTTFGRYATPFGNLTIDEPVIEVLREKKCFSDMSKYNDTEEHSLEMHLPYLYKRITQTFSTPDEYPTLVPVLVGDNTPAEEKSLGRIFSDYLEDPENVFVVSSDFCHWGSRFSYTSYAPEGDVDQLKVLTRDSHAEFPTPLHESIRLIDQTAMDAIATGVHDNFVHNLQKTRNTVCGRHPIGVIMAALERLAQLAPDPNKYRIQFVQYQRSSLVENYRDSSVSYAAAYAVV